MLVYEDFANLALNALEADIDRCEAESRAVKAYQSNAS